MDGGGLILGLFSSWRPGLLFMAPTVVWGLSPAAAQAQPAHDLCQRKTYEARYCLHAIEGWQVYLSAALIARNEGLARGALALVAQRLTEVAGMLPAARLEELRRITLWIGNRTDGSRAVYHPAGSRQPQENGEPAAQMGAIMIADPYHFLNIRFSQPSIVVHELSHGYHDQVLGFGDATVLAAFRNAQGKNLYLDVKRNDGSIGRAYALTNHREYFAELSEAYFGTNDFYPFRRDELRTYDPVGFEALRSVWEERPPITDDPISLAEGAFTCAGVPPRSRDSRDVARLVLRNHTDALVELFWLDFQGNRRTYARLEPGALHIQSTYVSHPWLIADSAGKCLAVVMPKKGGSYVALAP